MRLINSGFYIEYKMPDQGGYFESCVFKDFRSAQAAREELIRDGALEALIKRR